MAKDAKDKKAKRGIVDRLGVANTILVLIGSFLAIVAAVWFPAAAAKGWWPYESPEPPDIEIIAAQFDAPGDDRDNLNGEWVQIKNLESTEVDMSGWTLCDLENNNTYRFEEFILPAGGTVKIYSGCGIDSQTELYWGSGRCIWNNTGDTATLMNQDDKCVDDFSD